MKIGTAGSVVIVDRAGAARLQALDDAVERIKAAAAVPAECGSDIGPAPARGPFVVYLPREVVLTAAGGLRTQRAGHAGRMGLRAADVWDVMEEQARRAHARLGKDAGPFAPPFTPGQVAAGRDYAALTERVAAAGVRCASLEAAGRGGGGDGYSEALAADIRRLRALHRRIGDGLAQEVRRIRPSATGRGRSSIRVRALVDMVCLGNLALDEVLRRHGWARQRQEVRLELRRSLAAALDRMQGYQMSVHKGG